MRESWYVLVLACGISFGPHFCKHIVGPLRPFLLAAGWSPLHVGELLSAGFWPNLFLPLVAGVYTDQRGARYGAFIVTFCALLGHVLLVSACEVGSFRGALGGRLLYGAGEGGAGVVQGQIIARHFEQHLGVAIGVSESVKSVANCLGKAVPAKLASTFSSYIGALWILVAVLFLSVVFSGIFYASEVSKIKPDELLFKRHRRHRSNSSYGSMCASSPLGNEKEPKEPNEPKKVQERLFGRALALERRFWLLALLHLCFSNITILWAQIATSYIASHGTGLNVTASAPPPSVGTTTVHAAYIASLDSFLPIFLSPPLGMLLDRTGGRLCAVMGCSLCATLAFVLFAHGLSPILPMVCLALVNSVIPTLIRSALPLVVPSSTLGTALGVYAVFEAIGATVGSVLVGLLSGDSQDGTLALGLLQGLSMISFAVGMVLWFVDEGTLNSPHRRARHAAFA